MLTRKIPGVQASDNEYVFGHCMNLLDLGTLFDTVAAANPKSPAAAIHQTR
ncbi:MAG: hypothetical protein WKF84_00230 [Pyrinomonadaceae bacterium]